MEHECHFCHGIVVPFEEHHIVLDRHGDHRVALHEECAVGQDAIEAPRGSPDESVDVVCPVCGTVETV